jgi:uncharacterized protein
MRRLAILILSSIVMGFVGFFGQGQAALAKPRKGHLLYMTLSAGYKHASVLTSEAIMKEVGQRSGLFDTTVTQDVGAFTPENLKKYDVVMFYTSGELPMNQAEKDAFIHFVRSGHGFVGVHSATDTFYEWQAYLELMGGYFNEHPWHQLVTVEVADPSSPIVGFLRKSFQVNDEIYQIADFQYRTSQVLLRLDPKSVDLHKRGVHYRFYGWPLAWTRRDGKGRVFCTALGHEDAVWKSQWYQEMLLNGIKYAMGRLK